MYFLIPILLFAIGIISNVISIIVYCRKKLRATPMGRYFIILCISNIIVLLLRFYDPQYGTNIATNTSDYNVSFISMIKSDDVLHCKLEYFFFGVFSDFCGWIPILVSIDRLIRVLYPTKTFVDKALFQSAAIIIILIVLSMINLVPVLYSTVIAGQDGIFCNLPTLNVMRLVAIIDGLAFAFIPFVSMTLCSVFILVKLKKSRTRMTKNVKKTRNYQYAITVLVLKTLYFMFNAPICVYDIVILYFKSEDNDKNKENEILHDVLEIIMYLFNALHLLFAVIFNKIFRNELILIFSNFKNLLKNNKISNLLPITQSK